MKPLLPKPLMKAPHIAAFDAIIRNYIAGDTDLGPVNGLSDEAIWYFATILDFDTVPAAMLPYLSVMFDVDGIKGWNFATTEAMQRQCLKNALPKKLIHGTADSVKMALEDAGFLNVVITEHLTPLLYFDGSWKFDGTKKFYSKFWAMFDVSMDPPVGVDPGQVDIPMVLQLINYWKRKCTLLDTLTINQLVLQQIEIGEGELLFDGTWEFDGTLKFDGIG